MSDGSEAICQNAQRWLREAEAALKEGRWPTAVLCACNAIEEAVKLAHVRWSVGSKDVLGGSRAHPAREPVAEQVVYASEASLTGSVALPKDYPFDLKVGDNPIAQKAARGEEAKRMAKVRGLADDLRRAQERIGAGKAPARMKNLGHFRKRATYAERDRAGKWRAPEDNISAGLARNLVRDAWVFCSRVGVLEQGKRGKHRP